MIVCLEGKALAASYCTMYWALHFCEAQKIINSEPSKLLIALSLYINEVKMLTNLHSAFIQPCLRGAYLNMQSALALLYNAIIIE